MEGSQVHSSPYAAEGLTTKCVLLQIKQRVQCLLEHSIES